MGHRYFCGGYEFPREHEAVQYGDLMGLPITRETRRNDRDPLLGHGTHVFRDGGWLWSGHIPGNRPVAADPSNTDQPPVCSTDCPYRHSWDGNKLQRNALRLESGWSIERHRCGWNIKPGRLGGDPLDYAPCIQEHSND